MHPCLNCGTEIDETSTFCDDRCEDDFLGVEAQDADEDEEDGSW